MNPRLLGEEREHYLCAMPPSPSRSNFSSGLLHSSVVQFVQDMQQWKKLGFKPAELARSPGLEVDVALLVAPGAEEDLVVLALDGPTEEGPAAWADTAA